jgi:hypothetical protein
MFATVPAVLPKFRPEVASAEPQDVPAVTNDVENAGEAAAAVADHVMVDVETAVGAPVDALIAEITTVCVPATGDVVVMMNSNGVVVEPLPSVAPDDQSAVVPLVGFAKPVEGAAIVPPALDIASLAPTPSVGTTANVPEVFCIDPTPPTETVHSKLAALSALLVKAGAKLIFACPPATAETVVEPIPAEATDAPVPVA